MSGCAAPSTCLSPDAIFDGPPAVVAKGMVEAKAFEVVLLAGGYELYCCL